MSRLEGISADESGFSLVELLATISIGMIILFAGFTLLDKSMVAADQVSDRVDSTQRGRRAIEDMSQQLRSQVCLPADLPGTAVDDAKSTIVSGDPNSVTFYGDLGSPGATPEASSPERRRLTYSGGSLTEEVWNSTVVGGEVTFPAEPDRHRELAGKVSPPLKADGSDGPVFRYYAYNTATPPATPAPDLELSAPLSSSDAQRTVKVDIAFRSRSNRADNERVGTTLESSVFVRGAKVSDYTFDPPEPGGPPC